MKKQSALQRVFAFAGSYKYLTIASWVLSVISAWLALVPFYYIWRIIKAVLDAAPDYSPRENRDAPSPIWPQQLPKIQRKTAFPA